MIKWPVLTSVKKVQIFLEFINFYQKFIKKYSKVTAPLTELIRKDTKFKWFTEAQKVFNKLKRRFTSELILRSFNSEKSITLKMNALNKIIEACIS